MCCLLDAPCCCQAWRVTASSSRPQLASAGCTATSPLPAHAPAAGPLKDKQPDPGTTWKAERQRLVDKQLARDERYFSIEGWRHSMSPDSGPLEWVEAGDLRGDMAWFVRREGHRLVVNGRRFVVNGMNRWVGEWGRWAAAAAACMCPLQCNARTWTCAVRVRSPSLAADWLCACVLACPLCPQLQAVSPMCTTTCAPQHVHHNMRTTTCAPQHVHHNNIH